MGMHQGPAGPQGPGMRPGRGNNAHAYLDLPKDDFEIHESKTKARCIICHYPNIGYRPVRDCINHLRSGAHKSVVSARQARQDAMGAAFADIALANAWQTEDNSATFNIHLPSTTVEMRAYMREQEARNLSRSEHDDGQFAASGSWPWDEQDMQDIIFEAGEAQMTTGEEAVDEAIRNIEIFDPSWWPAGLEHPAHETNEGSEEEEANNEEEEIHEEELERRCHLAAEIQDGFSDELSGTGWFPFPNKAMCITNILFNSPRMRFSEAQQDAILQWGRELGGINIPTRWALDQWKKHSESILGKPTTRQTSPKGNIFYVNEAEAAVKKDMSNPITRSKMKMYPIDQGKTRSEIWHSDKWLKHVPDKFLTPMINWKGRHWFVNELVECKDERHFIPTRWFIKGDEFRAFGYEVEKNKSGKYLVKDTVTERPALDFVKDFTELQGNDLQSHIDWFAPESLEYGKLMPNPDRARAGGKLFYSIPYIVWCDDVSGNVSKQWNMHYACYISPANIPRQEVEKEFHTRFMTASQHAHSPELMGGVRDSFNKAFEGGVDVFDAESGVPAVARPFIMFLPGDNPMQAEECSHIGMRGNYLCRKCEVGGTGAEKQSATGFPKLFEVADKRDPKATVQEIREQICAALGEGKATAAKVTERQRDTGIKDALAQFAIDSLLSFGLALLNKGVHNEEFEKQMKAEYTRLGGDNVPINPCLDMPGVDVHRDTPVEILHTVLLGVVKYWWGRMWAALGTGTKDPKKLELLGARLRSVMTDGLNAPTFPADYMMQYHGSLIGKHFKLLQQVMPFCLKGLVSQQLIDGWLAIGKLSPMLWQTEIEDVDIYSSQLRKAINDFLHCAAVHCPEMVISKPKYHILLHIVEDIRRHGTAVLFSTERYESYNRVFRDCSVHSNRQSPSRDIGQTFAAFDMMKHICTGGWWWSEKQQKWVQAGAKVIEYIENSPMQRHWLGIPKEKEVPPAGYVVLFPKRPKDKSRQRGEPVPFSTTDLYTMLPCSRLPGGDVWCEIGEWLYAASGDRVGVGSFVAVSYQGETLFGRINQIALTHNRNKGWVLLDMFSRGDEHTQLHMPTLQASGTKQSFASQEVTFSLNVQHDCNEACVITSGRFKRQEREDTTMTEKIIGHSDNTRYIINTACLHNAQITRQALFGPLTEAPYDQVAYDAFRRKCVEPMQVKAAQKKAEAQAMKRKKAEEEATAKKPKTFAKAGQLTWRETSEPRAPEALSHMRTRKASSEDDAISEAQPPAKRAKTAGRPTGHEFAPGLIPQAATGSAVVPIHAYPSVVQQLGYPPRQRQPYHPPQGYYGAPGGHYFVPPLYPTQPQQPLQLSQDPCVYISQPQISVPPYPIQSHPQPWQSTLANPPQGPSHQPGVTYPAGYSQNTATRRIGPVHAYAPEPRHPPLYQNKDDPQYLGFPPPPRQPPRPP